MPPTDIFDLKDISSVVREVTRQSGPVSLENFKVYPFAVPEDFERVELEFSPKDYREKIKRDIKPFVDYACFHGIPENIYTALYEAVLNAFEHGNGKDPHKKVTLAYKISNEGAEFAVIDEGGLLDPEFMPFVLMHRAYPEGQHNFYEFSKRDKPENNNGTGTLFMHLYADLVSYYKSENGGLVVLLRKNAKEE